MEYSEIFINRNAINIYRYGSIVYNAITPNSDEDFIVIMPNCFDCLNDSTKIDGKDFSCYTENNFIEGIK